MKVLLLNGSPHREGNTATALNQIAEQLSQWGVASELVWIGTKLVRGCIDCCKCRELHLGQCIFDDDICNVIIRKLNDADGLIVGSPVYYGAPTGAVLSLLQRIFFSGAKVEGKPAAAVTICRRGGATSAFQTLQMPFQMVNMPIVTSQYWNIAYGCSPAEVARDDEGMQTLRTLADNMAWLLRKIHTGEGDLPEREPWTRTNFIR